LSLIREFLRRAKIGENGLKLKTVPGLALVALKEKAAISGRN
jgi:hypothetical protein